MRILACAVLSALLAACGCAPEHLEMANRPRPGLEKLGKVLAKRVGGQWSVEREPSGCVALWGEVVPAQGAHATYVVLTWPLDYRGRDKLRQCLAEPVRRFRIVGSNDWWLVLAALPPGVEPRPEETVLTDFLLLVDHDAQQQVEHICARLLIAPAAVHADADDDIEQLKALLHRYPLLAAGAEESCRACRAAGFDGPSPVIRNGGRWITWCEHGDGGAGRTFTLCVIDPATGAVLKRISTAGVTAK